MTALDSAGPIAGYYDSPWPGEDGGPRRQLVPRGSTLGMQPGEHLRMTSRQTAFANVIVLRDPGEVFLQGSSPPAAETTGWVERIDPVTLATLARSPDLPAGPFWPGGILAHANGFLYATYGRFCHKLNANCELIASRELPREQAYNSLLALSDGNLVMKNFVRDGSSRSYFTVLHPERLEPVAAEVEILEGSIARITKDIDTYGEWVYVVGDHTIYRYEYAYGTLSRDPEWEFCYRSLPDAEQSYGWDPVIADGSAWFMDNGEGVFRRSFAGGGVATGPLHLFRVPLRNASAAEMRTPFAVPRGVIANPPLVDASRRIVVAFDSGNSRIAGFRYGPATFDRMWDHAFGASNHFLLFPDSGEIVVNDFDGETDHVVVLDIESGAVRGRIATGSPVQSVVFQSPGWSRDIYTCSFTTVTRVTVE